MELRRRDAQVNSSGAHRSPAMPGGDTGIVAKFAISLKSDASV